MDSDDFVLDEIRGESGRKPALSLLNKRRITRRELDELFLSE